MHQQKKNIYLQAAFDAIVAFPYINHPTTIKLDELDLIKRCQRGNRDAQEQVYQRFADPLYRLAFRYIKHTVETEDVLLRAFMKIFGNIKNFKSQGEGSLEGWMRKIIVNEALMWLRSQHNFNLTESLEDVSLTEVDLSTFSALEAEDIYQFIARLPNGYRTVFNLFVVEGFSHQEIAQMLLITESTSRSQLFKAKTLLKKMLTQEGFQYGT